MIKFINKITGTEMWVAEDRAEEYLAAGHKKPAVKSVEKPTSKAPKQARKGK